MANLGSSRALPQHNTSQHGTGSQLEFSRNGSVDWDSPDLDWHEKTREPVFTGPEKDLERAEGAVFQASIQSPGAERHRDHDEASKENQCRIS